MKSTCLLSLVLALLAVPLTRGATIPVTSLDDSGPGTLRDALGKAADGDTIDATGLSGVSLLTSGELVVTHSVTIAGPGAGTLALDGTDNDRVFHIQFATVSISGLTITHGAAGLGGGIFNEYGTLTVSNCTVSANSADGRGGGIENYGSLSVVNSTLSENVAPQGGGLDNLGLSGQTTVNLNNSTLSGNAAESGGAISQFANGSSVALNVSYCTFSGNQATNGSGGGDCIFMYGPGAPLGGASLHIGSTILNVDAGGANIVTEGAQASVVSLGYNLSSDNGGYFLNSAGDQSNLNPMLGPLQDNGGPTFTHALLAGSPALNSGDPNFTPPPYFDQRGPGFPRVVSGRPDIGAFELQQVLPSSFIVTNTADSGPGTLRAGLTATADGGRIDATGVSGTIRLTSGELLAVHSVNIVGPPAGNLVVDGNAASRVFHISGDAVVTISSLTISNGSATVAVGGGLGGGIYNDNATLTLSNCTVSRNFAAYDGGGVYNHGARATLRVWNCKISGNFATFEGGGIENSGLALWITDSTISGNTATNQAGGGGIYNFASTLTVSNCTVSGNLGSSGGGILSESFSGYTSAMVTIANSTISSNTAYIEGGGICNSTRGTVTMFNSTVSGNSALQGGGINSQAGFSGNESVALAMTSCTICSNSAAPSYSGGGLGNYSPSAFSPPSAISTIGNTIFAGNSGGNIANTYYYGTAVVSLGYNLCSDNGDYFLTAASDQVNTDAALGPLQANGGPTFTHAPLPGSPAIDRGKNLSGSPYDQRGPGFSRTIDNPVVPNGSGNDGTDIGAVESQSLGLQLSSPAWDGSGGFQFSLGTASGVKYAIQISSDLKHWTPALAFQGSGGPVTVLDPNAASSGRRFYRVSIFLP